MMTEWFRCRQQIFFRDTDPVAYFAIVLKFVCWLSPPQHLIPRWTLTSWSGVNSFECRCSITWKQKASQRYGSASVLNMDCIHWVQGLTFSCVCVCCRKKLWRSSMWSGSQRRNPRSVWCTMTGLVPSMLTPSGKMMDAVKSRLFNNAVKEWFVLAGSWPDLMTRPPVSGPWRAKLWQKWLDTQTSSKMSPGLRGVRRVEFFSWDSCIGLLHHFRAETINRITVIIASSVPWSFRDPFFHAGWTVVES